jgi:hypothetical protein
MKCDHDHTRFLFYQANEEAKVTTKLGFDSPQTAVFCLSQVPVALPLKTYSANILLIFFIVSQRLMIRPPIQQSQSMFVLN